MVVPLGNAAGRIMGTRKFFQSVAVALIVALMSIGADAGAPAKPKKGDKAPLPPPANIEDVHVKGIWTRAARKGENACIVLTVRNDSESAVRLKGGEVNVAKRVRIVQFEKHGPMLRPVIVGLVPVEGHEVFHFEPGVAALELQEPTRDLHKGDMLPIVIAFARAGEIATDVEIDSRSADRYPDPPEKLEDKKKVH